MDMRKEEYLAHREAAIRWMNSSRRFDAGVSVLENAGFKPACVARLKRDGLSGPSAAARLKHLMRTLIQAWALPPSALEDTDVEAGVGDGNEAAPLSVRDIALRLERGELPDMPPAARDIVFAFRRAYVERDKARRLMASLGEGNDADATARRRELSGRMARLSADMDAMWPRLEAYLKEGKAPAGGAPSSRDGADDLSAYTTERLKFLRKSVSTKILRALNRLRYQSETRKPAPDPMPDGPARVRYETKVKVLSGRLEAIKTELARRVEC